MDHFGGARPEDVDTEDLAVIRRGEQLEHAVVVADDLAAGELAIARDPDLVGDRGCRELLLRLADVADLGDRVDPDRQEPVHRVARVAERVTRGESPLLRRGCGEAREPDHVADRVHARHRGLEVSVDLDSAPLVLHHADRLETEAHGRAKPACRVENRVGGDPLPARKPGDGAAFVGLYRLNRLAEPELHPELA